MGANSSDPNNNKEVSAVLANEVELYKTGKMPINTVRYQLFLLCASQLTAFHRFYQELSIQQIIDFFKTVQIFEGDEVNNIILEIAEKTGNNNDTDAILRQILTIIQCPYKKSKRDDPIYLSPCCCKELYKDIIKKKYKTSWGNYSPGTLFDFNSSQMKQMREFQETHIVKPQFQHSNDTCFVIFSNALSRIYNQPINPDEKPLYFDKTPSKPSINWEKNIHVAATKGNIKSLQYDIYLLPLLRDLQDDVGNTPVHLASKNGEEKAINALKEMNADFNIFNNNGNLPIHIVKNNASLDALISAGCYLGSINKNGQTIIETQSNPFNKDVIEGLFNRGVNILYPNQRGVYWMQYVIHNDYFPAKKKQYIEFQKFVRKIIPKCQYDFYTTNSCLQQILSEDVNNSEIDDAEFLRNAVINRDINKIITYLGMGARPDTKNDSGNTNLMMLAEKGDIELASVFANNYCDPNKTNSNGENSFWIAAWNRNYDLATMLQKIYYANPDILSNSGQTLMHIAYVKNIQELFHFLLTTGASPNVLNSEHESVQFIAFLRRDDQTAEMIQDEYNGDINSKGKEGNTLGHICILQHDNQRLEYILGRRLNIETKNDKGYSLFMCAIVCVDDLDLCQSLLGKGADINTQDILGETPFYYVCQDSHFCRQEFDFLLQNNCNINIQNNKRDFPISQLILKERKDEALILLDKKANIIDPQSPTEPICVAVMNRSQFWIDTLIDHGANAMNTRYPLIENYIKLEIFNFDTLKRLSPLNSTVGAPIQAAIKKRLFDVAHYLWDNSNEQSRLIISRSLDDENRIPVSSAILANDEYLVNQLIRKNYDLTTSDNIKRTPYMYACISNNQYWMDNIEQYISLNDLNAVDSQGNSALTFVANNCRRDIADHLFIKGVKVNGINLDRNGIIRRYVQLLDQYNQILLRARHNKDQSYHFFKDRESNYNQSQRKVGDIERSLNDVKARQASEGQSGGNPRQYDGQIRQLENDLRRERDHCAHLKQEKDGAERAYHTWSRNYNEIQSASRETILYHLDHLDHISRFLPPPPPPHRF